jgi:hypothetical protein
LDDFPIWGSRLPNIVRLGIFEGGVLASHVGIHFCEMKADTGLVPIALIGAVATAENHRGKGLSTTLLKEALRRIDEKKCLWSLLWGSEHEFYGKLGFTLCGSQARAPIAKLTPTPSLALSSAVQGGLTEEIFQWLVQNSTGIRLTESDREWIFDHKSIQWLWLESPYAFVAYGRGMDLRHMIHEFGGDLRTIQELMYRVFAHDPLVELMGRPQALEKLGFKPPDLIREYLCLARPLRSDQKWNDEFWVSGVSAC